MGRILQQRCSFEGVIKESLRRTNSLKSFRVSHLVLLVPLCLGADTDFEFAGRKWVPGKVNSHLQSGSNLTSATDYFRSYQSGDWSSTSTWESSPDNITWQLATEAPTKDANEILITSGHTVSISNAVSLDQTVVSGTVELQTGGIINMNDGAGDDVTILGSGVLQITSTNPYATAIIQNSGANIHIATNGKILIGNGVSSVGNGYESLATSLVNIWDDGSIYEYNINDVFAISSLPYFPNATPADIPIFRVTKVAATTINSPSGFTINGLVEIGANLSLSGTGKKNIRNGIRGTATLTQTTPGTGKLCLTGENSILDGASLNIVLTAVMDLSQTSTIVPVGANVTVSGANVNNNFASNVFTINGTLDATDIKITNTNGSIILNGTYRTSHLGGFSGGGSSITSGSITLNPGSTVELYASDNQSLNARPDFKNLIFSGGGFKTPTGPFNPAGTITIKDDAIFDCTGTVNGTNIGDDNTNLTMSGNSRLIVSSVNMNPKMGGTYNLTGGVIEFKGSGGTPQTIRSKNYQNIEITGTNVLMSGGNITLNDLGTFTIKNGAIFTANDNTINGPAGIQTVTVESGGLIRCGTNKGFHGFTITPIPIKSSAINSDIENIILAPNSTVEYSRSSPPLSDGDQPITTANGLIYQNLILSGTGNKTAPPDDLIILGNLSKAGSCTFIHNDGTVIFNGSVPQVYNATSPQMTFNNLVNQNMIALNVNSELSVCKKLEFAANSATNLNAVITLKSDKDRTASVAKIPANAIINYNAGKFVVERYIHSGTAPGLHGKSWQLLSAPALGETVFNTWQEGGNNVITNFGTWITDPLGAAFGFDATSVASSLKKFNVTNQTWEGVGNTNIPVADPQGYFLFVRGDRTVRNGATSATPTILRASGKLLRGDQPPTPVVANSYQSIGNPYASAVDFSKLLASNIGNSFYVWDPSISGNYNAGGYQTITASTGYIAVPGASTIYASNTDYRNIQSGQGFMVHNSAAADGWVQFTEESKMADGHHLVHREGALRQMLFANLYAQDGVLADGNAVVFDEAFSNDTNGDDASKMINGGENFGIKRNNRHLAVEARQPVTRPDTIFYELQNLKQQHYRLIFVSRNMNAELGALLTDRFLKTETKIGLSDSVVIDFSVTPDSASFSADRFLLALQPLSAAQLPVSFIFITGKVSNGNVFLEWEVENEKNVQRYEIEHSADGIRFLLREEINLLSRSAACRNYTHESPAKGNNFYRVRGYDKDGKSFVSPVVKVFLDSYKPGISIYPNPVIGEAIHLRFDEQEAGIYFLTLYNSSGEVLQVEKLDHKEGSTNHHLKMNKKIPRGFYILEIRGPGEVMNFLKVVK